MISAALTQGWSGLAFAYAAVQAPMLAGLIRGRAQLHKVLLSPVIAAPLTAAVGVGMALATPLLAGIGVAQNGLVQLAIGTAISTAIGYAGGRVVAENPLREQHISARCDRVGTLEFGRPSGP